MGGPQRPGHVLGRTPFLGSGRKENIRFNLAGHRQENEAIANEPEAVERIGTLGMKENVFKITYPNKNVREIFKKSSSLENSLLLGLNFTKVAFG